MPYVSSAVRSNGRVGVSMRAGVCEDLGYLLYELHPWWTSEQYIIVVMTTCGLFLDFWHECRDVRFAM